MGEKKLQTEPQLVDNEQMMKFEYMLNSGELEKRYSPEKFARAKQKIEAWQKVFYAQDDLGKAPLQGKALAGGAAPPAPPAVSPTPGRGPLVEPPDNQGVPFEKEEITDVEEEGPVDVPAGESPTSAWEAHKQKLKAGRTAGQFNQDYQTELRLVRPSAYIPGLGGAPTEDGDWWQSRMKDLPAGVRDKILSREGPIASRGAVWVEPTDEEALAGVRADYEARGLRPRESGPYLKRWKDQKWAEAYDAAKEAGQPIYRARDISTASPHFMKRAKADVERVWQPAEAFARQVDRGTTLGTVFGAIDTGAEGLKHLARKPFEQFDVAPPSFLEPDPTAQADVRRNLERGSRAVEQSPVAAAGGAVTGMVAPGFGNVIGKGATKALSSVIGKTAGRGVVGGAALHGAASGFTAGIEEMGASRLQNQVLEAAGYSETPGADVIPWSQSFEDAGFAGALAIAPGAVLGVPSGMSRDMRGTDTPQRAALSHLGPDSTTLVTRSGLKTPKGHEELAEKHPKLGAYGAARSAAVDEMADVFMKKGAQADVEEAARLRGEEAEDLARVAGEESQLASREAALQSKAGQTADELMSRSADVGRQAGEISGELVGKIQAEGEDFLKELQSLSTDIVDSSAITAKQTEEEALRFSDRFIRRAQAQRDAMREKHQEAVEGAYQAHGAPPRAPIPGPEMTMGAIEEARRVASDKAPYGLQPDYPTVDTTPIIDKISNLLADRSFEDGTNLPTSMHKKLKDMRDSLLVTRTMTPKEAEPYKNVFFDAREERGMVTFSTRRNIHVRELDSLIQVTDEAAKYPDSASPDAAVYRQLGAVMREVRDTGFPLLGQTKADAYLDLNETERMLRSVGLQKTVDELDPADIDQVRTIHENIKALARGEELDIPEGMAVPKKEFEQWLSKYDPELFDQYATLQRLSRQQQEADAFDITMNNVPMGRAKSLQLVEAALLGKDHDAAAVLETFKSYKDRVEALRQRNKRVGGLFEALGADKNMKSMSDFERRQYKVAANQFFLEGGPRFEHIREQMPAEFQKPMDEVRNAAVDVDAMFRAAGFGPSKSDVLRSQMTRGEVVKKVRAGMPEEARQAAKVERQKRRPTWGDPNLDQMMRRQDSTTRDDVMSHLHTIIKGYEKYKGEDQFDKLVQRTFKDHPNVMAALKRMTEERAFAWLRRWLTGDEAVDIFGAKQAWYAAATDFVQNHVDALVAHEGGKRNLWWGDRNPLDVPAPWAAGVVAPSENDPNREPEFGTISGVKAMEALFRAVDLMQAKEKQP